MTENTENVVLEETEVENLEPLSEDEGNSRNLGETALVSGVIAAAGYGIYRVGKDYIVPGAKKGFNWVKGKFTKKKDKDPEEETEKTEKTKKK